MANNQFTVMVYGASNLPNVATGPASAFATVNVLDPGEQIPEEGIQTKSPGGFPTSVVPKNPNPMWNAPIPIRRPMQNGARALVTVWHKDDAQGMCTKIGRVLIPLPPKVNTPIKQNLEDDQGIVIQGAGGAYAPITVGITMPGQQLPDRSQFVNKAMTPGPSGRSARLTESQLERRGYTSDQIKRTLAKQRDQLANEEKNLKADINDELLRMAEDEERNPFRGMRDVPAPVPASRHVDDLFMEPAGRPIGPPGPSAILDGLPIWSETEDPFNGMLAHGMPLAPAMPPMMDMVETGPRMPLEAFPMTPGPVPVGGGAGYIIDEPHPMHLQPQPQIIRVPPPAAMGPPPVVMAPGPGPMLAPGPGPGPMRMVAPPQVVGGPPVAPIIRVTQRPPVHGPVVTMPGPAPPAGAPQPLMMGGAPGGMHFMGGAPMGGPPGMPPTITAGPGMGGPQPMPMGMGMGGPPGMGMGMGMGAPQPPFLRPYDDHDLSGENF